MGAMQQMMMGGSGADHDPFFSSVVLLLHMDDTNPTDFSASAHTGTKTTARSATQSKFGGFSFVFNNAGEYLKYANHADFNFGTGDFTIELWWYPTAADLGVLWETGNSPFTGAGSGALLFTASRTVQQRAGQCRRSHHHWQSLSLSLNTWHHIVMQRSGATWSQYIDGAFDGTATSAVNLTGTGATTIGGTERASTDSGTGYIDELRVTKGVARYSGSSFAVPTAPFLDS
jgi:hypothetical protein